LPYGAIGAAVRDWVAGRLQGAILPFSLDVATAAG
jgi:hypothetical protein